MNALWPVAVLCCTCVLLVPSGCMGSAPLLADDDSEPGGSTAVATSTVSSTTTAVVDDTASMTSNDPTGVIFVAEPDVGSSFTCDLFEQDCPPGEKCTSWADDGGNAWNAAKCVPVVDDPVEVGEPCHTEGSPTSGIDDCDFGSMCFYVDRETLEGVCTPFCVGDASSPYCEDPERICPAYGDGAVVLCVPTCNPLEHGCADGQVCVSYSDDWICTSDASGNEGAYGDACWFVNGCDPGLVCLDSAAVPPGQACEGAAGCCSEICDITAPLGDLQCAGAAEGQTCQPWYEPGSAPQGYADVGACALP